MIRSWLIISMVLAFAPLFSFSQLKSYSIFGQQNSPQKIWADSVLATMSLDQKLGQLFMIRAYSNRGEQHAKEVEALIREYQVGGLIYFQGAPGRQVALTNHYQKLSKIPLLIAMDLEWGLGMRLDSTISFPKQMTLGAIQDDNLIYEMGKEIARQMKLIGVQVNFAPVVDINSNPANPVIGYRSFGENKYNVAAKGLAYMRGMQDQRVLANMKHFPGHGDTSTDSHYTLPVISHDVGRLDTLELYPFRQLIEGQVGSAMVAHINIPAYDKAQNKPTTLSYNVVTGLLKDKLNFSGLIMTDAMEMQGVAKYYKAGDADLKAFEAGNDMILLPEDVSLAIDRLKKAIKRKKISEDEIDRRVTKILEVKYWTGVHDFKKLNPDNIYLKLNNGNARALNRILYEKAITLVRDNEDLVPIRILDTLTFASLELNSDGPTEFQDYLNKYADFSNYVLKPSATEQDYQELFEKLQSYDVVMAGIHGMSNSRGRNYGLRDADLNLLKRLEQVTNVVVTVFGNPYSLKYFESFDHIICGYENNEITRSTVPQILFGALPAEGTLPVTASGEFKVGAGINANSLDRLSYGDPEQVGMSSQVLARIETIVDEAIIKKATPGAQILVARNGKVIYEKSFGFYTYDSLQKVESETIYDVASVTKVVATLQAMMFLTGNQMVDLDKKLSFYLPELKGTNKENMVIRDILTHQAGLWPFIPYYLQTVNETGIDSTFYSRFPTDKHAIQVAPDLYVLNTIQDSLWNWTVNSRVREKGHRKPYDYRYSDMGYYLLQKLADKLLNQPMHEFLEQNIYKPLGLNTLGYQPLCRFPLERIAPTEVDTYFRQGPVRGMVHDEGAALYGGVAGHAGIFSNTNDLAKILQMNLNGGTYGGERYLEPHIIWEFSQKQYENSRRGIGWDKPADYFNGPTSDYVSSQAFGHTGFTGTAIWADPEFDLVYIFLSNRVYPKREPTLIRRNIRTRVQSLLYESIWEFVKYIDQSSD